MFRYPVMGNKGSSFHIEFCQEYIIIGIQCRGLIRRIVLKNLYLWECGDTPVDVATYETNDEGYDDRNGFNT